MTARGARTAIRGVLLTLLVVLLLVVLLRSSDDAARVVTVQFDSAPSALRDQQVRVGGVRVGHVRRVQLGGDGANVELQIDDAAVWPLPRGTRAALRFGTTVGDGARFIELTPGPEGAPPIASGGIIPSSDASAPVEFDEVFNAFDERTRRDLSGVMANVAGAYAGRARDISQGFQEAPGGLLATTRVLRELGADREALGTLVRSAARTSDAIAQRDPQLRDLLTTAAATFDELAGQSSAITRSIERAPRTLAQATGTLRRVRASLPPLTGLVDDLGPGARLLPSVATPAARAVTRLSTVAPQASRTVRTAQRVSPSVTDFLARATPVLRASGSAAERFGGQAACLRPYTPELMSFLSTWASFSSYVDGDGNFYRALVQVTPVVNGTPLTSAESVKLTGVKYAFPMPPGWSAGEPWMQPQCGVGPEALDPSKDPERTR